MGENYLKIPKLVKKISLKYHKKLFLHPYSSLILVLLFDVLVVNYRSIS